MKVNVQTKSIFIYWYDNAICQIIQMTQHSSELVTLKNYFLLKIINSILYAATTNYKICNCVKITIVPPLKENQLTANKRPIEHIIHLRNSSYHIQA